MLPRFLRVLTAHLDISVLAMVLPLARFVPLALSRQLRGYQLAPVAVLVLSRAAQLPLVVQAAPQGLTRQRLVVSHAPHVLQTTTVVAGLLHALLAR